MYICNIIMRVASHPIFSWLEASHRSCTHSCGGDDVWHKRGPVRPRYRAHESAEMSLTFSLSWGQGDDSSVQHPLLPPSVKGSQRPQPPAPHQCWALQPSQRSAIRAAQCPPCVGSRGCSLLQPQRQMNIQWNAATFRNSAKVMCV